MRRLQYAWWVPASLALAAALDAAPIVSWRDAGDHVGEFVTIEGDVLDAHMAGDTCVIEFTHDDAHAFRALLLVPLVTSLPGHPDRLYRGKRIRASGLVRRYKGRPEMVLHNPGQIEVVDVAGAPEIAAAPVAPPPAPPSIAPTPERPAAENPPAEHPPAAAPARGLAEAVGRQVGLADACARARARWDEAARAADELAGTLSRCLRQGGYRCRAASAALAPALSRLEWAEQEVEDACP
jgi:hypothetical protein